MHPTSSYKGGTALKNATRRIALLGLCASVAMILSYVESLLPPILAAIPGIKMGLPNIVIVFVLYRLGARDAITVSLVRVIAVGLLFGTPISMAYSAAGAVLSLLGMALLKKTDLLSEVGVSVAGGVLHNVGQILLAMVLMGTAELGYYLVFLAISGTISGILIGLCGAFAVKRVKMNK